MNIYLRVDVDFNIGLKKGVPFLLNIFKSMGVKATFFVVMGRDTLYRHSKRMKNKDYHKRLVSFNILRLIYKIGPAYIRSKIMPVNVGLDQPEMLRLIVQDGHEIGLHGYNHADWADGCFEFSKVETEYHMNETIRIFESIMPGEKWVWGAPNWKCNPHMFDYLESIGVYYSSDTRGCYPFFPLINGKKRNVLQFPITMPCMHELIQSGISKDRITSILYGCLNNSYNLFCIHDYYEGILERETFVNVLKFFVDKGYKFRPLSDAYKNIEHLNPCMSKLDKIRLPGGISDVSCQCEFLTNNYFDKII